MLYLDHAATTPLRPEAREAMEPFLAGRFGNPSGIHGVSQRAKNALEAAREQAAELIGASRPLDIVFTGGGTEADNLAVAGAALAGGRRGGVVTCATEHEAVLETGRFLARLGCSLAVLPVAPDGRLDPDRVAAAVDGTTAVVSVMAANNETGVLQPIREIAEEAHGASGGVVVHTDAVQAFVAEEVTPAATGADLISLAAHKFGGPQGAGLLYVAEGITLEPVLHGGGQELGRRSGTHNVAGIVGMVAAMAATVADRTAFRKRVGAVRDEFETALRARLPDLEVNAPPRHRLPQHSHLRIPGVVAETLLIRLDRAGVAAAAGSACHSGALEISHVLAAMGMEPGAARECVRFSFGWDTGEQDGLAAAAVVAEVAEALR